MLDTHVHRSETVICRVHEHRAPTDDSIRLANEMREKITAEVVSSMPVDNNAFRGKLVRICDPSRPIDQYVADMKCLVTGATGFIGGHLARRLKRDGHDVYANVRRDLDDPIVVSLIKDLGPMNVLRGFVTLVVQIVKPEVVYHCAAKYIRDSDGYCDARELAESNVLLTAELAEASLQCGVKRFVNVSTTWTHYMQRSYDPVNLYAATKRAAMDILAAYPSLNVTTVELADTYGPGDTRLKLVKTLIDAAKNGTTIVLTGPNTQIGLTHVSDAVDALMAVGAVSSLACPVYTAQGTADGYPTISDIVATIERVVGKRLRVDYTTLPKDARVMTTPWAGGMTPPGWTPQYTLEQGIRSML